MTFTSSDARFFFQTNTSLKNNKARAQKAKNKAGNPIRLTSKLLHVVPDPFNASAVYVAEAAGTIQRVLLTSRQVTHTLRPATIAPTPVTCLAVCVVPGGASAMLYAGAWDGNIYGFPLASSGPAAKQGPTVDRATVKLIGHTDFIKSLVALPSGLLVSGSSDKSIIVWDASTNARLFTLKGHTRGVTALAVDPLSLPDAGSSTQAALQSACTVVSGDSLRDIRAWTVSRHTAHAISPTTLDGDEQRPAHDSDATLTVHATSILDLSFSSDGDLLTASADKTSLLLSREQRLSTDSTFAPHSDFVGAVALLERLGRVVTASRDGDLRVWDRGNGSLLATLHGHYDEVCALAVLGGIDEPESVVSVSIDGTLRRWWIDGPAVETAVAEYEQFEEGETAGYIPAASAAVAESSAMTAAEEAELNFTVMDDDHHLFDDDDDGDHFDYM